MEPKYKKPQIYRIIKNGNDTFYFEVKKNKRKFGINIIEHVLTDLVLFLKLIIILSMHKRFALPIEE